MYWRETVLILALVAATCGFVALRVIAAEKVKSAVRGWRDRLRGEAVQRRGTSKQGKRKREIGKLPDLPEKNRPESSQEAAADTLKQYLGK